MRSSGAAIFFVVAVVEEIKSDGSISRIEFNDGSGRKYTDNYIEFSVELYQIGAKGLPVTGLQKTVSDKVSEGRYYYCESDGSKADSFSNYILVRSGNKTYVIDQSSSPYIVMSNTFYITMYTSHNVDYSRLPAADAEKLQLFEANMDTYMPDEYYFLLNKDGSIRTNANKSEDGEPIHTNAYGMVVEEYARLFIKDGKDWYFKFPYASSKMELTMRTMSGKEIKAVLSIDSQGKILPICDAKTGKKLTGLYNEHTLGTLNLKNGLPAGGNQKITAYGMSVTFWFDPASGSYLMPMEMFP